MIALTLADIAAICSGELHADSPTALVSGAVHTDSREVKPGDIFFAKPGEVTDGYLFIPEAVRRGAALVIADRPHEALVPQIVVADTVDALGRLAHEVVARVRANGTLRIVGITGSNGKTTTKNLVRTILEQDGPTVAARASFNNEVGAPLTMLEVTEDTRFLVAEMGASRVGDIARLIALARPDVGVVLKVGLAHAGEFGGIERTVQAKSEMVTDLGVEDVAVLNSDDPRVVGMAAQTSARVVWFGLGETAQVRATDIRSHRSGTDFTVTVPTGESATVRFGVLGEHHVMNALAAIAVTRELGIPLGDIVARLETVTLAERWRMQLLPTRDGITIINDAYNASPDSMVAALKTLADLGSGGGRTIAVLGEMSELGEFADAEHDRIGLLAVRLGISRLVVVGGEARRMHLSAVNEGSWNGESSHLDTVEEAFTALRDTITPGDIVLVKSSNSAGLRYLGDRLGEWFE